MGLQLDAILIAILVVSTTHGAIAIMNKVQFKICSLKTAGYFSFNKSKIRKNRNSYCDVPYFCLKYFLIP